MIQVPFSKGNYLLALTHKPTAGMYMIEVTDAKGVRHVKKVMFN